jgi:ferredoxin
VSTGAALCSTCRLQVLQLYDRMGQRVQLTRQMLEVRLPIAEGAVLHAPVFGCQCLAPP